MDRPVWAADLHIDAALAAKLVAAQFPQFARVSVDPFAAGWDNAAFLVDGRVVFRFPRRRVAARLIEREAAVLPLIAAELPLAIPAPCFVGAPSAEYAYAFAGYNLIDGMTACSVAFTDASRAALARPLGEFLRALHTIDPALLVTRGLPPDEIGRLDPQKRLPAARERVLSLRAAGLGDGLEDFSAWLEAHPPVPVRDGERRLVHGDLYARHILIDGAGPPSGVIDWGDVHLGDPALDLAIAHLMLPSSVHHAFRDAYGAIDERTWSAARYRAIYHAILELDYGVRADDAGMREIGAAALRFMRV